MIGLRKLTPKGEFMKATKENVQEYIMKKITEQWFKDNPELVKDIQNLSAEFVLFNFKYGTRLNAKDLLEHFNS